MLNKLKERLNDLVCQQEELEECGDLEDRFDICLKISNIQERIRKEENKIETLKHLEP